MAKKSIPAATENAVPKLEPVDCGLTLGEHVLDIQIGHSTFTDVPDKNHLDHLLQTIYGLGRAAKFIAEECAGNDYKIQPVEYIADAIVILTMLSQGVNERVAKVGAK